jgi:hypothetical protein
MLGRHANVVRFHGICLTDASNLGIVMELASRGTLRDVIGGRWCTAALVYKFGTRLFALLHLQ